MNIYEGIRIKGEMSFCREHIGFSSILWVPLDEVPKLKELYGEPTDISKRLYMRDIRGWELNILEFIAIMGVRIRSKQMKLGKLEEK